MNKKSSMLAVAQHRSAIDLKHESSTSLKIRLASVSVINRTSDFPPIFFNVLPDKPRRKESFYGISPATPWDNAQVTGWAMRQCLPQTAGLLAQMGIDGRKLIRTDAVTLQNFGLRDGVQALEAEAKIRQLANCMDTTLVTSRSLPVCLYNSIRKGDIEPCPCYSPLSLLSTDPWMDNSLRLLEIRSLGTERWFWDGATSDRALVSCADGRETYKRHWRPHQEAFCDADGLARNAI
ncbi:unnamed protein product [Lymnaea stagnalis]|uniref:Uncharacterized protein n=1 Tax=Lymnaea stagnalis TaxID=6523 RepID=A0AAV2H7G4_LYMST